jgi:hypothetical protein
MYDTKEDAQNDFTRLSDMFDSLSKSKKVFERVDKTIAEYSDQLIMEETNSVQFILTRDELHDNKYKIFFRWGAFTYSE